MEIDGVFYETFKIERLYFKYIYRTDLQKRGITAEKLAHALEDVGLIKLVENDRRYIQLPKFFSNVGGGTFKKLWDTPNGVLFERLNT